jgi:hypothetical protein
MIGMPTPTFSPALGVTDVIDTVLPGRSVRNRLVAAVRRPVEPVALALTVYAVSGVSVQVERQPVPSADMVPGTALPSERTVTESSLPFEAVTVTPRSGRP